MYSIKEEFKRFKEKAGMFIAWRVPRWLVYFCVIRMGAETTTGKYSGTVVPDLKLMDAVKRWEKK